MTHADEFHDAMCRVVDWSESNPTERLEVLSNLDGLVLHTAEIADRVTRTVAIMKGIRIGKYALVVPSYLMRMQCRRLLDGIPHTIFDTQHDAMSWLGWTTATPRLSAVGA
jgi:hypothetical protein